MAGGGREPQTADSHSDPTALKFQEGLLALEQIVARLESGELSLEDALRAFEEGVGLVRVLNEKLNQAERRIELLTKAEDGTLRLRQTEEDGE